jgi:hypothetical protein
MRWLQGTPVDRTGPNGRAASAGVVPSGEVHRYLFEIVTRGSYKGFDFAIAIGDET